MKKPLFILSLLSAFCFLSSSCTPAPITIQSTATQSLAAVPTTTTAPLETPTTVPTPTPALTSTPDISSAIRVPEDQPTIQAGIDAAPDGGIVLVAPGIYNENLTISEKRLTLASQFHATGNEEFIENTVLDGAGQSVITVAGPAAVNTKIIGFTIQNGEDGIKARRTTLDVLNNRLLNNKDGVDYANSKGLNSGNLYEKNTDDGIDLDETTEVMIENNVIRENKDDGIEVRLHEYSGPTLTIVIRGNTISGNFEDGIQLIDYPDLSDRVIHIEHNLIEKSAMAGLGMMDNGETKQDYRAASIPERIYLINNTFIENSYGVAGGDNLIALNNIFLDNTTLAMKNLDGNSIAAYNLFWNNAADTEGSNVDLDSSLFVAPLLDETYRPEPGSPVIDAGIARFEWNGEIVLDLPSGVSSGAAPDLGAFESGFAQAFQSPWHARQTPGRD